MNAFFIVCAIAALATVPATHIQAVVAAAASTVFESIPFILAAALLHRLAPKCGPMLAALLSCGCAHRAGARSLAVLAFTALTFGPLIALARFIAAAIVANRFRDERCASHNSPLADAAALLPYAAAGSLITVAVAQWATSPLTALGGVALGSAFGFFTPCALGGVALAATVRHVSFPASIAILTISGVFDLRTWKRGAVRNDTHDGFAYLLAAGACAALAWSNGATLVNPRFAVALWVSAVTLLVLCWTHRHHRAASLRFAPLLMTAGLLFSRAAPAYPITETTLSNAAAGDSITFRGVLTRDANREVLVRYAITCCRADAQPIAVRLQSRLRGRAGDWFTARGTLIEDRSGLALHVIAYQKAAPPADPFIYR
ncbi:MAG: hypothetical protein JOZ59_00340 [Candidatus Eremiobacteraeota bacterium]|nr:hypothetical protein [Candidatus Eremiobacteraeota bacterium]